MKNLIRNFIALLTLVLCISSCSGGQGTTIVGNSSITISKLTGGDATITIGLDVFESDSATLIRRRDASSGFAFSISLGRTAYAATGLSGATIDILINGVLTNEGLSAEEYYEVSIDAVSFVLHSLENGDALTFIIHRGDGTTASYAGTVSDAEETSATNSDEAITTGSEALASRDLSAAASAYCDTYDAGNSDSQVAFGCYLATVLSLPESADFTAILDDFGETHVDVATNILGDVVDDFIGGGDESFLTVTFSTSGDDNETFSYTNYPNLPFNSFLTNDTLSLGGKYAQFAVGLNATGTTAAALQTDIDALYDDFEYLEELLDVVLSDEDFTFTIPAELFGTTGDLRIAYDQVYLHIASVQGALVGMDIVAAYDFGITAADVVEFDETDFDYEVLVADLNGTGETVNGVTVDTVPFLTLNNASRITGAESRATDALQNLSAGLAALGDNQSVDFVGGGAENIEASEAETFINDMLTSLTGNEMVELGEFHNRTVSVNLHEFFTNPPSAADVTSTDPFVFENDSIQMVESYFQDLLEGIAEF